jgi:hypothetical protein
MGRLDSPPFERGATFYNGGTIDTNDLGGANLEGREYVFEPTSGDPADPTGRAVRVRVVRNKSGIALKPKRVVKYEAADPFETKVSGYVSALADSPAGVVDEFLPAAGVPNNDLFYIVVDGPSLVTQPGTASSVAIGDRIVPTTGTSATNDDAGRVAKQDLTGATATLGNNIQNVVGFAAEANSTNNDDYKAIVRLASR